MSKTIEKRSENTRNRNITDAVTLGRLDERASKVGLKETYDRHRRVKEKMSVIERNPLA